MDIKKIDFQEEDFVIRIRPGLDQSEGTGEVDISIVASADNPLDDEGYTQLMHFCKMMCATVPVMESDNAIREKVHRYVMDVVEADEDEYYEQEKRLVIESEDGNVVQLKFNTDTKGTA